MNKNNASDAKTESEEPVLKKESQELGSEISETDTSKENSTNDSPAAKPLELHKKGKFKQFLAMKKGKVIVIFLTLLLIIVALMAVPFTRYKILGTFIKKNSDITVLDSITKKPVSEAEVKMGEYSAKTDNSGKASLKDIPLGEYKLQINKNYYTSYESNVSLPILGTMSEQSIELTATGRQVSVLVTDTISKQPLEKAKLTVGDTSSTTNADGVATIVLAADQQTLQGMINFEGYNETAVSVAVTDQADANKFTITPSGMIYFLSKQTGKINVMKSNLDGTNAKVVIEGTGNENDRETVLLAARDWRYMALYAKRKTNDKNAQLYLLDAKTDTLKLIDEGDVSMSLVGWSDHNFIYKIYRNNENIWDDKREALKNYNANNGELVVNDESFGSGSNTPTAVYESITTPYIIGNKVIYGKAIGSIYQNGDIGGRKASIVALTPASNQKTVIRDFVVARTSSLDAKLYKPQELYLRFSVDSSNPMFFEYENGTLKSATTDDDKFYQTLYPTFLYSPNGQKTLWSEPRNGKNAIFVGNQDANDSQEIAQQSEYAAYGWYTDKYILLNKNGSELYVAPAGQSLTGIPQKITNYHKPAINFSGYGSGYGGL